MRYIPDFNTFINETFFEKEVINLFESFSNDFDILLNESDSFSKSLVEFLDNSLDVLVIESFLNKLDILNENDPGKWGDSKKESAITKVKNFAQTLLKSLNKQKVDAMAGVRDIKDSKERDAAMKKIDNSFKKKKESILDKILKFKKNILSKIKK